MKELLMGNEAIAVGAMAAGVHLVTGYPGTPSTEILETVAKRNPGDIYVEWSVNEKAALEVAAGASYAGARTLVTMKQVGLNVASDPLMSLAYIGVKGGMVIVVADDPGPISSQTEQDTRTFAQFAKLPVLDPSSPEEACEMVQQAFALSEAFHTPVLLRPTTRICHAYASMTLPDKQSKTLPDGFVKDSGRWVIFPRLSFQRHGEIEARNPKLGDLFGKSPFNRMEKRGTRAIVTGGVSDAYVREALRMLDLQDTVSLLKIGTPFPFPEKLAANFLDGMTEVLVVEELDPVLEKALLMLCGREKRSVKICGKLTGHIKPAGENNVDELKGAIAAFLGQQGHGDPVLAVPPLPVRPPVLCAGCPHRASFYAVKQALKGKNAVFTGDIGCYTLGNAAPLDMVDTCLCMGADVTIAQGIARIDKEKTCVAFIGDSTFFASGLTGVANAVYNQTPITLVVLDNATTAMTGQQPHPGTGETMMGSISKKIDIEGVLRALGVPLVVKANPLDLQAAQAAAAQAAAYPGVSAVIYEAPCISLYRPTNKAAVAADKCVGCKRCITELGCPALSMTDGRAAVNKSLCTGCGLCEQVCPVTAIEKEGL